MPLNVEPSSGFVSENEYEDLTLEATLYSQYPRQHHPASMTAGDDDMIGIIVAYEEATDECNMKDIADHDPETCGNEPGQPVEPYVIMAARSGGGSNPTAGWALVYTRTSNISYTDPSNYNYQGAGSALVLADVSCCDHCGSLGSSWHAKYARVKIERDNNILTARTTDWIPAGGASRANALTAPYLSNEGGEAIVEILPSPAIDGGGMDAMDFDAIILDKTYEFDYNSSYNSYVFGKFFFSNGGSTCWIVSVGSYGSQSTRC